MLYGVMCIVQNIVYFESERLERSINLELVAKEIIENFCLGWKASLRDLPAVSITQLRVLGFSAVVYRSTSSRRSGTLKTTYLHD